MKEESPGTIARAFSIKYPGVYHQLVPRTNLISSAYILLIGEKLCGVYYDSLSKIRA